MKNKKSIWSTIILVVALVSLVLLVISFVTTLTGMPAVEALIREEAANQGLTDEAMIEFAITTAKGALIVSLVLASLFDILKIIGGLKFSLQGKWGMFCIVVSILGVIFGTIGVINDFQNKAAIGTIVTNVLSLALSVLLCVACFKHRAENMEA